MGYNYVQIQWIGEDVPIESIKESLDSSGLICTGTQDSFDDVFQNTDAIIERNSLWYAKYVCGAVHIPLMKNERDISALASRLNTVSRKLNEKDMLLEIHPLFPTFTATENVLPLDIVWEHLDNAILLQPDFYHVVRGKADPADIVRKYRGRIDEVHFKDFRVPDSSLDTTQINDFDVLKQGVFPLTPLGQGVIPWKEIIDACVEQNVKYCFVEQEAWDKDPFECMKESFDYLAGMGLDSHL
jgi:sugar phosphate isomerase/epimerase